MDVELFNFSLPEELIALRPVEPRDQSRLLHVDGQSRSDHVFADLSALLRRGDILVLNETKVLRASLSGVRAARAHGGGGDVELQINLHQHLAPHQWRAFARPAKRLRIGDEIRFSDELTAVVFDKREGGDVGLEFNVQGEMLAQAIDKAGEMPLPPYIGRRRAVDERDDQDYQTVYANEEGSVAAPTAGLHFTPNVFDALAQRGVEIVRIILHVGAGTFLPVSADDTDDHTMHSEWYSISDEVATRINTAKRNGGRIIAVGTTALRALESSADSAGELVAQQASTEIFITPGYEFKIIDGLLTNFHLPKSTLFMLVSALAGMSNMKRAYHHAVEKAYRFYSYGDTSLLWRSDQ